MSCLTIKFGQAEIPTVNNQAKKTKKNGEFSIESANRAGEFIQGAEGCEEFAYQDDAGVWTIGYGHTGYVDGKPITKGMRISKEKAEELYKKDFERHVAVLNEIETPLSENQKIALSSFIYNFGVGAFRRSDLYKKLQIGDYKGAADEFDKWINIKDKRTGEYVPSNGLINRRKKEKNYF